ncbi:MAG TPA: hypothetical protein VF613_08340 [Longimicrobium sp.]|jgi:hypothetical protein
MSTDLTSHRGTETQREGRVRVFALALLLVVLASAGWAQDSLAGRYSLRGVREMAAEIVLGRDGRFAFALTYGALDQVAQGKWSRRGNRVVLVSESAPPPSFGSASMETRPEAHYERLGDAAPLVVRVTEPESGAGWRNVDVAVELSDGRTVTGTTVQGGRVEFPVAAWKGARLRRIGVAYPAASVARRWYTVPDAAVRTMVVDLQPGSIIKPAFATRTLYVTTVAGRTALRMEGGPGTFVR